MSGNVLLLRADPDFLHPRLPDDLKHKSKQEPGQTLGTELPWLFVKQALRWQEKIEREQE